MKGPLAREYGGMPPPCEFCCASLASPFCSAVLCKKGEGRWLGLAVQTPFNSPLGHQGEGDGLPLASPEGGDQFWTMWTFMAPVVLSKAVLKAGAICSRL